MELSINRLIFFVLLAVLSLFSCDPDFGRVITESEEEDISLPEGMASTIFNVRLTDDPIDLDEVNIDLQQVFVKGPDGFEEISIGTNAGIYDLLDLQNGIDVIIASAEDLEIDQIREVRLVLGENNSVVVEGETFDLKIPSGNQSGLKIKVCLDLTEDMPEYNLLLDFDAAESVKLTGSGKYMMHPVIRVMNPDAQCDTSIVNDDDDDNPSLDNLPQNVKDFLNDNYADYNFKIEKQPFCDNSAVYLLSGEDETETIQVLLYFDADWVLVQTGVPVSKSDIPEAVPGSIAEDYPEYSIMNNNTWEIERAGGDIWYRVYLKQDKGSKKIHAIYAADGTFICQEE